MKDFCKYCFNDPVTHNCQKELCGVCEVERKFANIKPNLMPIGNVISNPCPKCKKCGGFLSEVRVQNGKRLRHCFSCHFEEVVNDG